MLKTNQDLVLQCVEADCQTTFTVPVSEQEWLAKHLLSIPKRCAACRRLRKARLAAAKGGQQ